MRLASPLAFGATEPSAGVSDGPLGIRLEGLNSRGRVVRGCVFPLALSTAYGVLGDEDGCIICGSGPATAAETRGESERIRHERVCRCVYTNYTEEGRRMLVVGIPLYQCSIQSKCSFSSVGVMVLLITHRCFFHRHAGKHLTYHTRPFARRTILKISHTSSFCSTCVCREQDLLTQDLIYPTNS